MLSRLSQNKGVTLVEAVVVVFIFGFFTVGMVNAYIYGLKLFKSTMTMNLMYTDGMLVLNKIEKMLRNAESINVFESDINPRMDLIVPEKSSAPGQVEFYVNASDKSLRMNDRRVGHGEFNVRLLPATTYSSRRRTVQAYKMKRVKFEYARDVTEGIIDPQQMMVRVIVVLENPEGDTLVLRSTTLNRNYTD